MSVIRTEFIPNYQSHKPNDRNAASASKQPGRRKSGDCLSLSGRCCGDAAGLMKLASTVGMLCVDPWNLGECLFPFLYQQHRDFPRAVMYRSKEPRYHFSREIAQSASAIPSAPPGHPDRNAGRFLPRRRDA